jgi:hypothetical protein
MKTPVDLVVGDDYLGALLVDYEAARSDDRSWAQVMGTVFGILVALLGGLLAAIPALDILGCKGDGADCPPANSLLLAGIPLAPVAVLSFAVYVGMPGVIRSYYLRGLENEIRRVIGDRQMTTPPGNKLPVMSWNALILELTSLRRGRSLYRSLVTVISCCALTLYGGLIVMIFLAVDQTSKALMAVFYSAATIYLLVLVHQVTSRGRELFVNIVESFHPNSLFIKIVEAFDPDSGGSDGVAGKKSKSRPRRGGSFALYLLYPRPVDLVKWVFVPISVVLFAALSQSGFDWRWHHAGLILLGTFIFEGLLYAARYQVNDVRDYARDASHSAAEYRGRLPLTRTKTERRDIVIISLGIAMYRILLAFVLIVILAPSLLPWTLIVLTLTFISAVVHEYLKHVSRNKTPDSEIYPSKLRTNAVWMIWVWVGSGYAIRGIVAWRIAEFIGAEPPGTVALLAIIFLFAFGVTFVTETWALEATSFLIRAPSQAATQVSPTAADKPHVIALASFLPHAVGNCDRAAQSEAPLEIASTEAVEAARRAVCPAAPPATDPLRRLIKPLQHPAVLPAGDDPTPTDAVEVHTNEQPIGQSQTGMCTCSNDQVLAQRSSIRAPWVLGLVGSAAAACVIAVLTPGDWSQSYLGLVFGMIALVAIAASALLTADMTRPLIATVLSTAAVTSVLLAGRPWAAAMPLAAVLLIDASFRASSYHTLVSTTENVLKGISGILQMVARATLGDSTELFPSLRPRPADAARHARRGRGLSQPAGAARAHSAPRRPRAADGQQPPGEETERDADEP